jgi:Superinfection immunity protein
MCKLAWGLDADRRRLGTAIGMLNAVAGWTVIGWIVLLVAFALLY